MRGDVRDTDQGGGAEIKSPFDSMFYTKSDEKFTVRALLDEIFADRRFNYSMDVGPGAGHVTEPLAQRSRHLVLVEKSQEFHDILKKRFPEAEIMVSPIEQVNRTESFDVIMLAHLLYYHPEDEWVPLLEKMSSMLSPSGELIVALNSDAGDWWRLLSAFWDELQPLFAFDYIPLSELRKTLMTKFNLKCYPYRYQLWVEPDSWTEVVGKRILEVKDHTLLPSYERRFREFSSSFRQVDGNFVLDMRAEILRLTPKQA